MSISTIKIHIRVNRIIAKTPILLALIFCAADIASVRQCRLVRPPAVMQNTQITESSGLAASNINGQTILWTHNDSGDSPRIFALSPDGADIAEVKITGARSIDWEDMASFTLAAGKDNKESGQGYLLLADTGANNHSNKDFQLYLLREPVLPITRTKQSVPAQLSSKLVTTIEFSWPEGARADCEAIAVDISDKKIYLAQKKHQLQFDIYTIDLPEFLFEQSKFNRTHPPVKIRTVPQKYCTVKNIACITAMDISSDNRRMVLLNYSSAYEFTRQAGQSWKEALTDTTTPPTKITLPPIKQSEAICYDQTGQKIYITTEKLPTHIFQLVIGRP